MADRDLRGARRYATALFGAAQKQNKLDIVGNDLRTLLDLMEQTPTLRQVWDSPLMPAGHKRDLLSKVLAASLDSLTLAFLRLLIDKRREYILDTVQFEMQQLTDAARRLVRAQATFAVAPTPEEQTNLIRSLEKRTGDHIDLTVSIDPAILGGVVIRMQDTILDGSVRGSLERIREQLLQEA